MSAIQSVAQAMAAFPGLKWKTEDRSKGEGVAAFAICGGDKTTGDITIFLALADGAREPLHRHCSRVEWPFRETITCLAGELHGIYKSFDTPLRAGQTVDLNDGLPHAPFVPQGGFALIIYRQPGGHVVVAG